MTIEHPYENLVGGRWLKGNLHAHTTNSDGERATQAVIDDYAARGYSFLAISDHDICTTAKEHARFDARGMALIPANEITANGPHMLYVGSCERVEPLADRQRVIDAAITSGGLVVLNHPNWESRFNHCPQELMERWTGYIGLEVFNGVIGRLDGSPYATNRWDMLLAGGRRPCWGFANDDSHAASGDVGLGWNMVYARDATPTAIVDALRRGRFYPSTGVTITNISVNGNRIRIETENAERIVALREVGKRFAIVDARSIDVEVPQGAKYARFECWGRGENFAWTQPFWVKT